MRIITGRPVFLESMAGTAMLWAPRALLPNPPPQYLETSTTRDGAIPPHRARNGNVWATLCVDPWRKSFPFCQYAIADRDSSGWWGGDCWKRVSTKQNAALS